MYIEARITHERLQKERSRGGKGGRSGSKSIVFDVITTPFGLLIRAAFTVEAMGRKTAATPRY
jgi:hypothetical protein